VLDLILAWLSTDKAQHISTVTTPTYTEYTYVAWHARISKLLHKTSRYIRITLESAATAIMSASKQRHDKNTRKNHGRVT